jgi:hypothetical protein
LAFSVVSLATTEFFAYWQTIAATSGDGTLSKKSQNISKSDALPNARQAWRVAEYCEAHRISPATFYKFVGLGKIKVIRIGGRTLVSQAEASRIMMEGLNS